MGGCGSDQSNNLEEPISSHQDQSKTSGMEKEKAHEEEKKQISNEGHAAMGLINWTPVEYQGLYGCGPRPSVFDPTAEDVLLRQNLYENIPLTPEEFFSAFDDYLEFQTAFANHPDTKLVPNKPKNGVGATITFTDDVGSTCYEELTIHDKKNFIWQIIIPNVTNFFKKYTGTIRAYPDKTSGGSLVTCEIEFILNGTQKLREITLKHIEYWLPQRLRSVFNIALKKIGSSASHSEECNVPIDFIWSKISNFEDLTWVKAAQKPDGTTTVPELYGKDIRRFYKGTQDGYITERIAILEPSKYEFAYQVLDSEPNNFRTIQDNITLKKLDEKKTLVIMECNFILNDKVKDKKAFDAFFSKFMADCAKWLCSDKWPKQYEWELKNGPTPLPKAVYKSLMDVKEEKKDEEKKKEKKVDYWNNGYVYKVYYMSLYLRERGRGIPVCCALEIANKPYEYYRLSVEDGLKKAEEGYAPYKTWPVMEIAENVKICQSNAILRFIGKHCNLYPEDVYEQELVDSVMEGAEDLTHILTPNMEAKIVGLDILIKEKLPNYLHMWHELTAKYDSGFVVGNKLTVADLKVSESIAFLKSETGKHLGIAEDYIQTQYPKLQKVYDYVENLPAVKRYFEKYPKGLAKAQ